VWVRDSVDSAKPAAGFRATDMSLELFIMWAYHLNDYQWIGAPGWASDHYDICARQLVGAKGIYQQVSRGSYLRVADDPDRANRTLPDRCLRQLGGGLPLPIDQECHGLA
jgi:hypothetical protein